MGGGKLDTVLQNHLYLCPVLCRSTVLLRYYRNKSIYISYAYWNERFDTSQGWQPIWNIQVTCVAMILVPASSITVVDWNLGWYSRLCHEILFYVYNNYKLCALRIIDLHVLEFMNIDISLYLQLLNNMYSEILILRSLLYRPLLMTSSVLMRDQSGVGLSEAVEPCDA